MHPPASAGDASPLGPQDTQHSSSAETRLPADERAQVTLARLDDQIAWYDTKSTSNQRWFKLLKGLQLLAAAAIPVAATIDLHPAVAGGLGTAIIFLEGFQQLNQYQQNWISYRSTCEALKHEKYLFWAKAGPYAHASNPRRLLADRVESQISREHAKWVSTREEAAEQLGNVGSAPGSPPP